MSYDFGDTERDRIRKLFEVGMEREHEFWFLANVAKRGIPQRG